MRNLRDGGDFRIQVPLKYDFKYLLGIHDPLCREVEICQAEYMESILCINGF